MTSLAKIPERIHFKVQPLTYNPHNTRNPKCLRDFLILTMQPPLPPISFFLASHHFLSSPTRYTTQQLGSGTISLLNLAKSKILRQYRFSPITICLTLPYPSPLGLLLQTGLTSSWSSTQVSAVIRLPISLVLDGIRFRNSSHASLCSPGKLTWISTYYLLTAHNHYAASSSAWLSALESLRLRLNKLEQTRLHNITTSGLLLNVANYLMAQLV